MPRHTHRHKPACVQGHWRQAHRCHPISGEGGNRGARWKGFECEILAGTISCLLTPSSCSPQPRSTTQHRSLSLELQHRCPRHANTFLEINHCIVHNVDEHLRWSGAKHTNTCIDFHRSRVKKMCALAKFTTCTGAWKETAMSVQLNTSSLALSYFSFHSFFFFFLLDIVKNGWKCYWNVFSWNL